MSRLSTPWKIILTSGTFLALIAVIGLVCAGTTVHTSNVDHVDPVPNPEELTANQTNLSQSTDESKRARQTPPTRSRSARLYQQASQPVESYAAAYAADQLTGSHLTQQATSEGSSAGDSSAYSSFGEAVPAGGQPSVHVSSGSIARQLSGSSDYSTPPGYYGNHHMSPSTNEASYSGHPSSLAGYYPTSAGAHHSQQQHHQYKSSPAASQAYGYPTSAYERGPSSYYDRAGHHMGTSSAYWPSSSSHSGGLMSSASHALSHWTNGFSIGEIICGLVALTIGAVILGAPFFLIYLALMGNFSGSGTLSLTNPTSPSGATGGAIQTNGRRKRLAVFETMNMDEQASKYPEFAQLLVRQLSPLVDLGQVSKTLEHLVKSIEKYSPNQTNHTRRANKQN